MASCTAETVESPDSSTVNAAATTSVGRSVVITPLLTTAIADSVATRPPMTCWKKNGSE